MTPGPKLLLQCAQCNHMVIRFTINSGNTIGATLWTDGYVDTPMLPRHALFEYWYCPECGRFQEVEDMLEVARKELGVRLEKAFKKRWKKADYMEEPTWREYLKGIKQWEGRLDSRPDLETHLRMLVWRRYNDVYRNKLESQNHSWRNVFSKSNEKEASIEVPRIPEIMENCNDVATWLYEGNPDTAMDKADILRWLGRYELAVQLLEMVPDLKEFDEYHKRRHEKLLEMSRGRDSSLGIVPDDY